MNGLDLDERTQPGRDETGSTRLDISWGNIKQQLCRDERSPFSSHWVLLPTRYAGDVAVFFGLERRFSLFHSLSTGFLQSGLKEERV